jgi:hypothetical protein
MSSKPAGPFVMQLPGSNIDQVTTAFVTVGPSDKDHSPFSLIILKFKQLKSSTARAVDGIRSELKRKNIRAILKRIFTSFLVNTR